MKIIRTFAYLVGAVALVFGASSCKKDDDSVKCCTFTYVGETEAEKVCENDEDFKVVAGEDGATWSEYAATMRLIANLDPDMEVSCD